MKRLLPILTALMLVGLFSVPAQAQDVTCDDIEFNADLLADYPDVGDACLEIIEKGGERFAKLHLQVWREGHETITVLWQLRDGGWSSPHKVTPPEGWSASVSGQDLRVNELEKGQELDVYVREGRWEMAMADSDVPEMTFAALDFDEAPEEAAEAPAEAEAAPAEEATAEQMPAEAPYDNTLLYILGATVLVILIWLLMRRKKKKAGS